MSGGSAIGDADLLEMMSRQSPNADHDRRKFFSARGTSLKSSRRASEARSTGSRPRSTGRGRDSESHREHDYGETNSNGSRATGKRRSKSLGQRMTTAVATTPRQREMQPAPTLNLYHVSRPEPRARWVFNLSSHLNVADNGPPPARVTSQVDKKRPNLGGLVWVNATLGGHCCLQKGTKSKVVTPVPPTVLDGWLNGQTGFWWIGALKDGHRALWDSHVVMSWAMVFIPSSPEVAARNNMEVWRDKCLKGSLRVARPGELERKIIDIVTDDQDAEPESVVHTHLCILLADGDDLELKRPRMFSTTTPRALETLGSDGFPKMKHSKSLGSIAASGAGSTGRAKSVGGAIDLSQIQMVDGAPTLRSSFGDAQSEGDALTNKANLQEAMEKVERYRERILILKEDRHAKKAMLVNLREELQEKEEMFTAENERLRQERNEIRTRAKVLWMDLENLRRQTNGNGGNLTADQASHLRSEVERLRRERNEARGDAMRWLEEQKTAIVLPGPSPASTIHSARRGARNMTIDADGGDGTGEVPEGIAAPSTRGRSQGSKGVNNGGGLPSGLQASDYKTAAAMAKLRAKVDRLRKERDGAEAQAAKWLNSQREKLLHEMASTPSAAAHNQDSDGSSPENAGGGNGMTSPNGPVVASLKAESLRLKRELDSTKKEAQRWRERAANNTTGSLRGIGDGSTFSGLAGLNLGDSKDENSEDAGAQARKALGQLLGQALNLLDPHAAADVAAAAATNVEETAPTSDSETIVAKVAKESGGQQWATADAANPINGSPRTRSNSPPTAQLVRVATLVGGK